MTPGAFLVFTLRDLNYAVAIESVREIQRVPTVTPLPETPDYITGVMNVRGRIVPIVDLRVRFGLTAAPITPQSCVVITESRLGTAGLLVDTLHGVISLQAEQIEPRPMLSQTPIDFVLGMAKLDDRILVLLDLDRVLTAPSQSLTPAA